MQQQPQTKEEEEGLANQDFGLADRESVSGRSSSGEEENSGWFASDEENDAESSLYVYRELAAIRRDLKERSQLLVLRHRELEDWSSRLRETEARLDARERSLRAREECLVASERLACEAHDSLLNYMKEEISLCAENSLQLADVPELKAALKKQAKENSRLCKSYQTLKHTNDMLRKQLQESLDKNKQLEIQMDCLHRRVTNLIRRNELLTSKQHDALDCPTVKINLKSNTSISPPPTKPVDKNSCHAALPSAYCELLGVALRWIYRLSISASLNVRQSDWIKDSHEGITMLPHLASMLPDIACMMEGVQLSYLEFIYWVVSNISERRQKVMMASTLRRIGEEIYSQQHCMQERTTVIPMANDSCCMTRPDLHIRILSNLIVLKTLSQADCLARVLTALKLELKEDIAKEVFLEYNGVDAVLYFLKPPSKALWGYVADIYLQMSMESALLSRFLGVCSCRKWFATLAFLLKEGKTMDVAVIEKLSVVLQKLSKIKDILPLFKSFQFESLVEEALHTYAHTDGLFLCLNLRSVLGNITAPQ